MSKRIQIGSRWVFVEGGEPQRPIVLVEPPLGEHARRPQERALEALHREGFVIEDTLLPDQLGRLSRWIALAGTDQPVIVAAGGDWTVGAAVRHVANTGAVLGILPLGRSNEVARSLGIPKRVEDAVQLLSTGNVSTVDIGRFAGEDGHSDYFVRAAAIGVNPTLAGILTRRQRRPFACELLFDRERLQVRLLHLSVVNSAIFPGGVRKRTGASGGEDGRLDVVTLEDTTAPRLAVASLGLALRRFGQIPGVKRFCASRLRILADQPSQVRLDGELSGRLPAEFAIAAGALRVIAPARNQLKEQSASQP